MACYTQTFKTYPSCQEMTVRNDRTKNKGGAENAQKRENSSKGGSKLEGILLGELLLLQKDDRDNQLALTHIPLKQPRLACSF